MRKYDGLEHILAQLTLALHLAEGEPERTELLRYILEMAIIEADRIKRESVRFSEDGA